MGGGKRFGATYVCVAGRALWELDGADPAQRRGLLSSDCRQAGWDRSKTQDTPAQRACQPASAAVQCSPVQRRAAQRATLTPAGGPCGAAACRALLRAVAMSRRSRSRSCVAGTAGRSSRAQHWQGPAKCGLCVLHLKASIRWWLRTGAQHQCNALRRLPAHRHTLPGDSSHRAQHSGISSSTAMEAPFPTKAGGLYHSS